MLQHSCYLLAEGWSVLTCPLQKGGSWAVYFSPSASGCPAQGEARTVGERLAIRDHRDFPADTQGACVKHPTLSQVPSKTGELFVDSATIILKHDSQLVEADCTLEDDVTVSDQEWAGERGQEQLSFFCVVGAKELLKQWGQGILKLEPNDCKARLPSRVYCNTYHPLSHWLWACIIYSPSMF